MVDIYEDEMVITIKFRFQRVEMENYIGLYEYQILIKNIQK